MPVIEEIKEKEQERQNAYRTGHLFLTLYRLLLQKQSKNRLENKKYL